MIKAGDTLYIVSGKMKKILTRKIQRIERDYDDKMDLAFFVQVPFITTVPVHAIQLNPTDYIEAEAHFVQNSLCLMGYLFFTSKELAEKAYIEYVYPYRLKLLQEKADTAMKQYLQATQEISDFENTVNELKEKFNG